VLQLDDRVRGLFTHVVDGILVTKPIGSLDRIVHVPPPVVFGHVTKGGLQEQSIVGNVSARARKWVERV
jgi:hypothetical protein